MKRKKRKGGGGWEKTLKKLQKTEDAPTTTHSKTTTTYKGARINATIDRWPEGHEKLLAPSLYSNANPSKKQTPQHATR